jgi:hypothetical protein
MSTLFVPNEPGSIYIPGRGKLSFSELAAAKAVEEYDADLVLGQRNDTSEWVVFIKNGPINGEPFPVLGLGFELPAPEKIKEKLYRADTKRHGGKIVEAVERHNERLRKEYRDRASDGAGQAAEAFEWAHRQMGSHPNPRIFVPS